MTGDELTAILTKGFAELAADVRTQIDSVRTERSAAKAATAAEVERLESDLDGTRLALSKALDRIEALEKRAVRKFSIDGDEAEAHPDSSLRGAISRTLQNPHAVR